MSFLKKILVVHFDEIEVAQQVVTFIGKTNKTLLENLHV